MTAVSFQRVWDRYVVSFRYDAGLVALVKAVPSYARSWDSVHRQWLVDEVHAVSLAAVMRQRGHTVTGVEPPSTQERGGSAPNWARSLFTAVGRDRAEPVFRALTRILHPDNPATGDGRLQQDLNNARDELRSR